MKIFLLPRFKDLKKYCVVSSFVLVLLGMAELKLLSSNTGQAPEPISRGNENEPKVALTCNVFWGEEFLPDMLDTLEKNDVHITFFIGGTWAKSNPELLKKIAEKGHELANHSYNHPHPNALSKVKNQEQILHAEEVIKEITGIKTNLYAPPYGEYNDTVLKAAEEIGYPTIVWSIDTVDWKRPPPEIIKSRVLKKLHHGAIVLMHPTEPTAKALPSLIEEIKKQGYTITTVSDMINTHE